MRECDPLKPELVFPSEFREQWTLQLSQFYRDCREHFLHNIHLIRARLKPQEVRQINTAVFLPWNHDKIYFFSAPHFTEN